MRFRASVAAFVSLAVHLEVLVLAMGMVRPEAATLGEALASPPVAVPREPIEVLLEPVAMAPSPQTSPQQRGGGAAEARPDDGRAGRGGRPTVTLPAINLAPRDDLVTSTRVLPSHLDGAQYARRPTPEGLQRSPEDDRVSPAPTQLTFLTMGPGSDAGRVRAKDAGATRSPTGSPRDALAPGLTRSRRPATPGDRGGEVRVGQREASPATARPSGLRGAEASPADELGHHADRHAAEQVAPLKRPSLLSASTAGGRAGPPERGGTKGAVAPAAGGAEGAGFASRAHGAGQATGYDPATHRHWLYLRRVQAKIDAAWSARSFPRRAALAGRGGYTIVAYRIHADGSVDTVQTLRPSGFPSFDAAMRAAVMRASPFEPLPPELRGGLSWAHHFRVTNPAVR